MATPSWKASRDPLYRGDAGSQVQLPAPAADPSLVRHILYLGGRGRLSPYLSLSESREVAQRFAGREGRIYRSRVPRWPALAVAHRSRSDLVQLLRGQGKGEAAWPSAFEVMQARRYVEENAEHLADFRALADAAEPTLRGVVDQVFDEG
ncbi:MAG: hypothetical protein HUU35_06720 [Armatimonadetes bacterium]|nr:hypothetical protein [Armatimonadota bacterium]